MMKSLLLLSLLASVVVSFTGNRKGPHHLHSLRSRFFVSKNSELKEDEKYSNMLDLDSNVEDYDELLKLSQQMSLIKRSSTDSKKQPSMKSKLRKELGFSPPSSLEALKSSKEAARIIENMSGKGIWSGRTPEEVKYDRQMDEKKRLEKIHYKLYNFILNCRLFMTNLPRRYIQKNGEDIVDDYKNYLKKLSKFYDNPSGMAVYIVAQMWLNEMDIYNGDAVNAAFDDSVLDEFTNVLTEEYKNNPNCLYILNESFRSSRGIATIQTFSVKNWHKEKSELLSLLIDQDPLNNNARSKSDEISNTNSKFMVDDIPMYIANNNMDDYFVVF